MRQDEEDARDPIKMTTCTAGATGLAREPATGLSFVAALPIACLLILAWLAQAASAAHVAHVLWFDRPASSWEEESLPIGNGAMGATIAGGVHRDRLQFNEKTLWTGGPGASDGYDFGLPATPRVGELAAIRQSLVQHGSLPAEKVAERLGRPATGYGNYQSFGELLLDFQHDQPVSDYRRELDIGNAIATVSYRSGGISFTREYFASFPDQVIVLHLAADTDGQIGFDVTLRFPENRSARTSAAANGISAHGNLHDNGLAWAAELRLMVNGGVVSGPGDGSNRVRVAGADSATLILALATNYAATFPDYRGEDPRPQVRRRSERALELGAASLRARHQEDHGGLFGRVALDLGGDAADWPIDAWLSGYGSGNAPADRALEALYFQYGRYLLIASSRDGSLPANLQGVWNESATPPWNADYHVNVNLQMNYWPAEVANMPETAMPLFDFVDSLVAPGRRSAELLLAARGWTLFLNTNIWGFTGVIDWPTAFWQPEAAAWLAQHYYEHYRFSGDRRFLEERAYPVMKAAALTWIDALVTDPSDGLLVVSPSYSPEHGDFTAGAAMSQQIIAGLMEDTGQAARILGDVEFAQQVEATAARLDPGLRIGSWGQLQEWKADVDDPDSHHRHVSHLFALYPGRQITPATPELLAAARKSLDARGDAGTGWSRAWKINLRARLGEGDRAHGILAQQLRDSTLPNLWSSHPPFQIDGNFGATAGIAEMLLQSHAGIVHLLPALPSAWPGGVAEGLRARGELIVDIAWQDGALREAVLRPARDLPTKLRAGAALTGCHVIEENGKARQVRLSAEGLIDLTLRAGRTYRVSHCGQCDCRQGKSVAVAKRTPPPTGTMQGI